jgi:hypothetical protein
MPEFISKVQHNTYEKGEFSDEKVRTLSETLELIKTFPFDAERTVTDIQLTGPSVTIQDEYVNYLKVGLYFGGKLCVYYLDNDNHLYECYVRDVDAACNLVTDFFNGKLDPSKFEKHLFNIGNQGHFVTDYFEYHLNKIWVFFCFLLIVFISIMCIVGTFAFFWMNNAPWPLIILYIFLDILALQSFYFMIGVLIKSKNTYLQLSKGNDSFNLSRNGMSYTYNKVDISQINIYGQTSRSSRIFNLMELVFKDNSSVIIPGAIIDPWDFIHKFKMSQIIYVNSYAKGIKAMWNFINSDI